MAAADYYSCDLCASKTFYDAELNYEWPTEPPYEPTLPGVGGMKVLCVSCAKTHEVVILPRAPASISGGRG